MDELEGLSALQAGINKELAASQQGNRDQVLNYDFLSGIPTPVHVVYVNPLLGTTNSSVSILTGPVICILGIRFLRVSHSNKIDRSISYVADLPH
jgi:hypothetical protein